MKKEVQIYMSSTSFGFFDFRNKNWKRKFMRSMRSYDFYLPYNYSDNDNKVTFKFIDPLQTISNDAEIVKVDLDCMHRSNYIVVYLPKKLTIGTMMELTYSILKFGAGRVVLIDKTKIHRNHPWIKYWLYSECIADDEEDAAKILSETIMDEVNEIWKDEKDRR